MAKQRRALVPLTESETATVRQAAASSQVPLSAKELAKLVILSRPATVEEVTSLLQPAVGAGTLFFVPGSGAKAKPLYWGRDPVVVLKEAVSKAIAESERPLTAAELMKLMTVPFKVSSEQVDLELAQQANAGQLHMQPATAAKGKPRYWDRDPLTLIRPLVVETLGASEVPLSAKDLVKRLSRSVPGGIVEVEAILSSLVNSGQIAEIPPTKKGGACSYRAGTLSDWGRKVIGQLVRSKGPQPEPALKKAISFLGDQEATSLIQSMVDGKELYLHPPFGAVKKTLYSSNPPSPEPYLQPCGDLLKSAIVSLRAANVPEEQIRRSLVQLFESTGIQFRSMASSHTAAAGSFTADLPLLMKQLEPGAERGALVGLRELRGAAKLSKADFDQLVLNLSRQGQLSLHRHDFPASLTSLEREDLVQDANGTYYVGVALRQNRQTPNPS